MKIAVFGATGSVGRLVVEQALEKGHDVTAFGRDRARLTALPAGGHLAVGDVLDPTAVDDAVRSQDAVLICLGAGRKGGVRAAGTATIVAAMQKAGVKRLVCQSTLGAGDSRSDLTVFWKYLMFGVLLRPAYLDHQQQERIVIDSGLDWTVVRPAAFTDGARTGRYRHGFTDHDRTAAMKVSRADVADFMLRQMSDDTYLRRTPALSY